ncbi:hypothetical protein RO955_11905 [Staphylococcus haemolyticus]|uniref:Uncharacterized protein n=1 Tax=Staphylococcus haemolyticus TaxID=1283 RepID=A0ABU3IJH0_STAHA|nr:MULTISPECIES: hypothetical protein [Staphylococcus]MBG3870460.1 hypothetical protein [Staphylococcus haemolyticus]MDT4241196.1 hypothetical protein [Staphylococcus haemolyticus]MDT4255896.1 hypothetical protein [Staphylococcus haemolyticus]MDT4287732.1 hypothetical protein [Staphylococcus haemolyticus]MDT4299580.1 hypothetical protein [Staphylococcus haemolyticus]
MDNKETWKLMQEHWELVGHIQANANTLNYIDEVRKEFNGVMRESASLTRLETHLINIMKDDIKKSQKTSKQLDAIAGVKTSNVLSLEKSKMLKK